MIAMSQLIEMRKNVPSGTIILNRPAQRNALSRELIQQLEQAFLDFQGEKSVRAVILTASGDYFSAGTDLKELHATAGEPQATELWQEDIERLQSLLELMLRYPKPIITALNGQAYGMGAALVLATDLVIAHNECGLSLAEGRWGLSNCVGAALMAFRGGAAAASPYLLAGQFLSADRAAAWGLFHELVRPELVWARAQEIATAIASQAHQTTAMTKRFINEAQSESLFTFLSIAFAHLATARTTDAAREGLQAFVERRTPQF